VAGLARLRWDSSLTARADPARAPRQAGIDVFCSIVTSAADLYRGQPTDRASSPWIHGQHDFFGIVADRTVKRAVLEADRTR
jgi:hypothetical protein